MNPDRQCTGTSSQSGERCRKPAILGGNVCEYHGGSAPQVRAAAQRRLAEDKARRTLDQVGVDEVTDPIAQFKAVVSESVALKSHLATQLAALEGSTDSRPSLDRLQAALGAYERSLDRAGKLLATWVSLGLEERWIDQQATITAEQMRLLANLALLVFDDPELGLRPEQQWRAERLLQEYAAMAVAEGLTAGVVDGEALIQTVRPGWQVGEVAYGEVPRDLRSYNRQKAIARFGSGTEALAELADWVAAHHRPSEVELASTNGAIEATATETDVIPTTEEEP